MEQLPELTQKIGSDSGDSLFCMCAGKQKRLRIIRSQLADLNMQMAVNLQLLEELRLSSRMSEAEFELLLTNRLMAIDILCKVLREIDQLLEVFDE
jgi:hypothetical protein